MYTIVELINLLKTTESSLRKNEKHVMLMDSSSSKKCSKNKKNMKSTRSKGGVAKKKAIETTLKGIGFHCGKNGH